jgi:hypothetical protein
MRQAAETALARHRDLSGRRVPAGVGSRSKSTDLT